MSEAKKKPKTTVQERINARLEWLQQAPKVAERLTPHQKVAIVWLISEGATLVEIAERKGMPSGSSIFRELDADAEFRQAYDAARSYCATMGIEEAHHNLRQAVETGDTDKVAVANAYHKATLDYAAKIAPREFGQLVKLAGADGGALTINVTNYAEMWGGTLRSTEVSHATQVPGHETVQVQAALPSPDQSRET